MSLAIEKILAPATGHPARHAGDDADQKLNIAVVFTSVASTLTALKEAGNLASDLGARIMLVVPQVVPYPLPLDTPPVLIEFNENRFRVMASQSSGGDERADLSVPRSLRNADLGIETRLHRGPRRAEEMVANQG